MISAIPPIVDGVEIYDEVWCVIDDATGNETPLSELPDDDEEEPTPVYGQAGFVPILAVADAPHVGLVAIEAEDGYTYYYEPDDVE